MVDKYSVITFILGMLSLFINPLCAFSILAIVFSKKAIEDEGNNIFIKAGVITAKLGFLAFALRLLLVVLYLLGIASAFSHIY